MIPIQATHVSGVVISRIDGVDKILLLKRVKGGYWCHVAGGVEAGETGWQTILRELKEEHTEYRWCSLEEAKQLTPFANQHHLYDHVWQYYVDVESLTPYTLIEQNS
ncbi:NUDIX domain-containing protein [Vibrio parahaemolyticus]|uniref:NUDIX domain-containing protein n=1 Tax=Vibrio parahaemolyticus TaxID=670 RepID=UPI0005F0CC5C|nr:NUDIX domain-containing protein [Vibrio parahaemolyticus]EJE8673945.1 NUDIX domain-containing protein [Vibrio parahaemolyticus]EKD4048261.1 NUDIX domain-containing protein [Vibrio parahaemolyticus]EKM6953041.1 NUDIX domain-containing protein [Vibrio parahaemolyticus]NVC29565.1 NUDIX domain-containing protein [Vibrio parahaemolyticus]HAS6473298.1 NUDIX domain-containing protein [Vibrio parahaemolyticus]